MSPTTIKVDHTARDRLAAIAQAQGTSMGLLLSNMAERLEFEQRWTDVEVAYERMQREDSAGWASYLDELASWDLGMSGSDASAAEEWPEYNA